MDFFILPRAWRPSLLLPLSIALLFAASASSQKLMELRLKDGRVLVGNVSSKGGHYEVSTPGGKVTVSQGDVASRRMKNELQQALKEKAAKSGDSAFAHLHLAKQACDYGLKREMWMHIDKALEKLPVRSANESNPVERRLRDFLAQLEPELLPRELRQAPLEKRIQAMLRLFRADTVGGKSAALEELLVREAGADQLLRHHARHNSNERQRIAALSALQRRQVSGNGRFVLRTTVFDKSQRVRTAAAKIGKPSIKADDIAYMAAGLAHANAKVRVRTAFALGNLGHKDAINLLVKAAPHAATGLKAADNGATSRGHVAFLQQRAYIRDFDVEVASAAFIADPKVDVIQSGSVLDVTVVGVYEVRTILKAYRSALKQLSQKDPGADPRSWPEWHRQLSLLPKAAKTPKR